MLELAALTEVPDVLARDGLVLSEAFVDAREEADLLAYCQGVRATEISG